MSPPSGGGKVLHIAGLPDSIQDNLIFIKNEAKALLSMCASTASHSNRSKRNKPHEIYKHFFFQFSTTTGSLTPKEPGKN